MIYFGNTEIAFESKTDAELRRAHWLFQLLANPGLVRLGSSLTRIAVNLHLPVKGLIKSTIFSQFCGGETIAKSQRTIEELRSYGIGTILDYSVEGKGSEADFEKTTEEVLKIIQTASGKPYMPFAVFKPTGLGRAELYELVSSGARLHTADAAEFDLIRNRYDRICAAAVEANTPVFVDAEESWMQAAVDDLVTEMSEKYNKQQVFVYHTVQMYRHDRLAFMHQQMEAAVKKNYKLGFKIVRGAYMEKERERAIEKNYPSPIQIDKAATDKAYDQAVKFCVTRLDRIALCAGTHNETSTMLLTDQMKELGIDKSDRRIYFAQLYGMSDHISFNLSHLGYNVAKYVPYGPVKKVLPYLIRRAEENTSVQGQTGRELALLKSEIDRRKRPAELEP